MTIVRVGNNVGGKDSELPDAFWVTGPGDEATFSMEQEETDALVGFIADDSCICKYVELSKDWTVFFEKYSDDGFTPLLSESEVLKSREPAGDQEGLFEPLPTHISPRDDSRILLSWPQLEQLMEQARQTGSFLQRLFI
jgi:hypothetical protein